MQGARSQQRRWLEGADTMRYDVTTRGPDGKVVTVSRRFVSAAAAEVPPPPPPLFIVATRYNDGRASVEWGDQSSPRREAVLGIGWSSYCASNI